MRRARTGGALTLAVTVLVLVGASVAGCAREEAKKAAPAVAAPAGTAAGGAVGPAMAEPAARPRPTPARYVLPDYSAMAKEQAGREQREQLQAKAVEVRPAGERVGAEKGK